MLKITLIALGLAASCGYGIAQTASTTSSSAKTNGSVKSAEKTEVKPVYNTPVKAEKATTTTLKVPYAFDEKAFIKDYLVGTTLPANFPKFGTYKDTDTFRRDLKKWIYENPALVKEEMRIY
jgi:hypothetical protein